MLTHPRSIAFIRALAVVVACAASVPVRAEHFLWEVTSMTNRVYLFGTIHAGKKDWYPLPAPIEEAFAASPVTVVEADITDTAAMARTATTMAYAPPDELSKHVPPEEYQRFLTVIGRANIAEERMKRFKPFTAVALLVFSEWEHLGYRAQFGLDPYIIKKAQAQNRKLVELEGIDAQAKLVDSLTEAEQQVLFSGTLTALESGLTDDQIEGLVKAWQLGDAFLMLEVARRYNEKVQGAAVLEEKFIWSRHESMMAKVEGFLNKEKERHFIAVGALHLCGKRGLVEMLRAKGYLVRQL